ncbi:protein of unknown function [Taphrina deformans PYCC 5710]|uniref:Pentatricopeptide repeat protein n=1 Tax=Taphrina deformans (strain PYCC 5710 / ATCC 11124 / CBS 356.35 / IMI 108563 / JCM 9778 / NBRC 8474) TaxID=1097556 RepID=R4X8M6_TAPDE|nr:protein of unknown function [Taphrina deformans PYCC 5710]|eukprot:CCG81984.1 protein of unknown function [Taphrina deformans PYCC 5710]
MYDLKLQLLAGLPKELCKVETLNIALQHFVKAGQLSGLLALLESLDTGGYLLDVISYNTVLNAARAGAGNEKYLNHVLRIMSLKSIEFSTETYNILISSYHQLGMHAKALTCFREALATRKAATSTYNTIISQELSGESWHSAWSILVAMRKRAIPRNEKTYSPFLLFLSKNNMPSDRIAQLLEMMNADAIPLDSGSYNTVLHSLLFSGMYESAQKVLMAMREKSVKVTERTFNVIQHFLGQCSMDFSKHPFHEKLNQFVLAEVQRNPNILAYDSVKSIQGSQAWDLTRSLSRQHVSSQVHVETRDARNHSSAKAVGEHVQALMVDGAWRPALASYKSFKSRGIIPPMQIVVSVLVGLLHSKRYREAQNVYRALKERHPATSDIRFQTVVLELIKPQNIVRDIQLLLKFLVESDSRIDIVFHSAASWRLYREQKYPEAIALLKYAIGLGILLDLAAWVILVECYAKTRDLLSTIWCLQAMKDNKIILDKQARKRFKRVLSTLETEGNTAQVDQAWALLDHLRFAAAEDRAAKHGLTASGTARKERPFVRHVPRTHSGRLRVAEEEEEADEEIRMAQSSSM